MLMAIVRLDRWVSAIEETKWSLVGPVKALCTGPEWRRVATMQTVPLRARRLPLHFRDFLEDGAKIRVGGDACDSHSLVEQRGIAIEVGFS